MIALFASAPALLPVARPHGVALATGGARQPWDVAPPPQRSLRSGLITMKGKKGGKPKGENKFKPAGKKKQGQQEKQSVKNNRQAEQTKSFIYTILGLTKALPDGTRTLIKNINLCFFPGAKIGLVGLNGAGKSTLMKIMAGVDTECNACLGLEHHRRADTTAVWV